MKTLWETTIESLNKITDTYEEKLNTLEDELRTARERIEELEEREMQRRIGH